jgi:hypothetical protein
MRIDEGARDEEQEEREELRKERNAIARAAQRLERTRQER